MPVIIYNISSLLGYSLRPEWLAEIADHPNVAGYKDSTGDLPHHLDVLRRTRDKDFKVLIGKERLLSDAFKAGTHGLVLSFANVFPELCVTMADAAKQKDWESVDECQRKMNIIFDDFEPIMAERPFFSTILRYFENELEKQGFAIRLV